LNDELSDIVVKTKLVKDEDDLKNHLVVLLFGLQEVDQAVEKAGLADEVGGRGVGDAGAEENDNLENQIVFGVERGRQLFLHPRNLSRKFTSVIIPKIIYPTSQTHVVCIGSFRVYRNGQLLKDIQVFSSVHR
jgi:hypothetical protein